MAKKKSGSSALAGAYLANGTIGNKGTPGAPTVDFSLVVVPGAHKVSGMVACKQATAGGNYTGHVTGTIYSTGFGPVTQVVALHGTVTPSSGTMPIEIPFEAHMAINGAWSGTGGFSYANVHVDNVPVKPAD